MLKVDFMRTFLRKPIAIAEIKSRVVIHYLKNKVGVVDFANAPKGPEGLAGFEILPLRGLL